LSLYGINLYWLVEIATVLGVAVIEFTGGGDTTVLRDRQTTEVSPIGTRFRDWCACLDIIHVARE